MSNNTVEFKFKLNDQITQSLKKLQGTYQKVYDQTKKVDAQVKKLPLSIADLRGEMAALEHRKTFAKTEAEIIKVNKTIRKTQKELQRLGNLPPQSFLNRLGEISRGLTGISLKQMGVAFAIQRTIRFTKENIRLYDVQAKAEAQLRSSLESTGFGAGRTFNQLSKQASELQDKTLFNDQDIIKLQSRMLKFTKVRGEAFDKSIGVILDYATKELNGNVDPAVNTIGKAINDPVLGVTGLRRVGTKFTDEQEEAIKRLVEAGKEQEAQLIIINELQKQYGGSAAAAAEAGIGPMQQLSTAWTNLREKMGATTADAVNRTAPALTNLVKWVDKNGASIKNFGKTIAIGAAGLATYKITLGATALATKTFSKNNIVARLSTLTLTHGVKGLARAMAALNTVTKANIIGAAVSAIVMAAAALKAFKKNANMATDAMKSAKEAATSYYASERSNLDIIFEKLKRTNPKSKERNELVQQLKEMYPDLNQGILDEITNTNNLSAAYDTLIAKIAQKARVKAKESLLEDISKEMNDFDTAVSEIVDKIMESQPTVFALNPDTGKWEELENDRVVVAAEVRKELLDKGNYLNHHVNQGIINTYKKAEKKAAPLLKQIGDLTFGSSTGTGDDPAKTPADIISGLTSGGSRETNIHINFRNLIEFLNMYPQTVSEGVDEVSDELTEGLLRVVNSANRIAQQ